MNMSQRIGAYREEGIIVYYIDDINIFSSCFRDDSSFFTSLSWSGHFSSFQISFSGNVPSNPLVCLKSL